MNVVVYWFIVNVCSDVGSIWRLQSKCSVTYVQCDRHICSGTYASKARCMYTSASGHIIDCIEFMWSIYTDSCLICTNELICICRIYMALEGIFVVGTYMVIAWQIKIAICSFLTWMWSNLGSICRLCSWSSRAWQAYLLKGICQ